MGYSIFDDTMVDLPWPELEKKIADGAIALLPTGVIEEHGPHMSLGVDTYLSYMTCKLTKQELETAGIKTLIVPPFYWGINNATGAFPGSFTVRKETMKAVIYDILASLVRWGITYVFNINWHEDSHHCNALFEAIREARVGTGVRAFSIISDSSAIRFGLTGKEEHILVYKDLSPQGAISKYLDIHAGSFETGMMTAFFPNEVDSELTKTLEPSNTTFGDFMIWRQGWSEARKTTPLGYLGNPADFKEEDCIRAMESYIKATCEVIQSLISGKYHPLDVTGKKP
ncbi:MAG: creatininase family protein [Clostridia bacterium]|nr:creatininase family protein [Clostridia bacterium]